MRILVLGVEMKRYIIISIPLLKSLPLNLMYLYDYIYCYDISYKVYGEFIGKTYEQAKRELLDKEGILESEILSEVQCDDLLPCIVKCRDSEKCVSNCDGGR